MSEQAKTSRDISSHDEEVVKTKMNDDVKASKGAKVTNIDARRDTSKGTGNEREARLETALRANLRKRKQQARARSEQK